MALGEIISSEDMFAPVSDEDVLAPPAHEPKLSAEEDIITSDLMFEDIDVDQKQPSGVKEHLISGAVIPLKVIATPFIAGQEAIKDVGRFFQGKPGTFGEDIARLWHDDEIKTIYEDLSGEKLSETLKRKTPLGKTWYGESIADLASAIEEAGEAMLDPLLGATVISGKIASKIPKGFQSMSRPQKIKSLQNMKREDREELIERVRQNIGRKKDDLEEIEQAKKIVETKPKPKMERRKIEGKFVRHEVDVLLEKTKKGTITPSEAEKLESIIYTDSLTNTKSKTWWEINPDKDLPFHAEFDADSLKFFNDNISENDGNRLLKRAGDAFNTASDRIARTGGDEFRVSARTEEELEDIIQKVYKNFNDELEVVMPDGSTRVYRIGLTHGTGADEEMAGKALKVAKVEKEKTGLRAPRGEEPPRVFKKEEPLEPPVDITDTRKGLEELSSEERKVSQAGKITFGKEKASSPYAFKDKQTEELFESAKGTNPTSIFDKVRSALTDMKHKMTREYEHLARNEENAQLIFNLKRLEKQRSVVAEKAAFSIGETLSGISKKEYDLFTRKVILDDLQADIGRGLYLDKKLPFNFTPESMTEEFTKINTAIGSNPKVKEALLKRDLAWSELKDGYIKEMKPFKSNVEDMFKDNYYRHEVLDHTDEKGIFGTGKRLKTPNRGYMKGRTGYAGLYNTDFLESEHKIMSQMLHDMEISKTLTKVKEREDILPRLKAMAKKQKLKTWEELMPDGYKLWQPKEGNIFYPTLSIPEKMAEKIMTGALDDIVKLDEGMKTVLAMGRKRPGWVVRNDVADTLDNLVRERASGFISEANLSIMRGWKRWQLISPRRYVKYSSRNFTGDAEAVFLGNVSGFKKSPQATKELYEVLYNKKQMSEDMMAWFERGGLGSTLQAQEMDSLKKTWVFSRLHDDARNINVWKKYWREARVSSDFRESILRYANFLDYKEQLIKGNGIPKNYGASKPKMIDALESIDDKAFWLSNDLLGAYDRISVAGQVLRERAFPFFSWQEVNFKRYIQLYKNAADNNELTSTIGKQLGAKGTLAALKVGRLALKTTGFLTALQVYNHTRYPELEGQLSRDLQATPHMIFGKDENGEILYFSRMGTLDDFVSWFGLDNVPRFIGDLLRGRPVKELLKEQAEESYQAPVNKVVQGVFPFIKLSAEVATGRSTFPDVFKPGTIRDKWFHIARSVGMEEEYKSLAGKPSKGYGSSVKKLFLYSVDPGEAAYRDVYDMKSRFLKSIGRSSDGFWLTSEGDALYNMKLAIKYEDKEAFSKYFSKYISLPSQEDRTPSKIAKSMERSLKNMNPLSGMSQKVKEEFIQSRTPDDLERLEDALAFFNETLLKAEKFGLGIGEK